MFLQTIKLANFKNYEAEKIDCSPRLNCLVGLNGMGKTNLLDAIFFTCLTKSHTGLTDRQLIRQGESFFRIEAIFQKHGLREQVVAKFQPPGKKEIERNGVPVSRLADHIGQFPVVLIAPDDVRLVQDGSEERRRFLDTTLSQIYPSYLSSLLVFNHLLKQRNALLKKFWDEKQFDPALLEAIDRQMPEPARLIFEFRKKFVGEFAGPFQAFYETISEGREQVSLEFDSDLETAELPFLFEKNLEKDRFLQRTASGPHRDDLVFKLNGQPVKRFASQGQLKSFLLAIRLSQHEFLKRETGLQPLLLLDDIFDRLDAGRTEKLIELLMVNSFGQIFITDTHETRVTEILRNFTGDFQRFVVDKGRIEC